MSKNRKWKKKLADFLTELRGKDLEGEIKREVFPKLQAAIENENNLKTPDISYLLRFLRIILDSKKELPQSDLLHRLIILVFLARIEALTFVDERQLKKLRNESNLLAFINKRQLNEQLKNLKNDDKEFELKNEQDMQVGFKKEWMKDIDLIEDRSNLDALLNFHLYWNGGEIEVEKEKIKIENHGEIIEKHFEKVLGEVEKELETKINKTISEDKTPSDKVIVDNYAPTLADFPEAFDDWVIILGDYYGEINRLPEYHFELFRKSASNTVLTYLPQLGLSRDGLILSDHLIMRAKESVRGKLLADKNILVIGSPLVNIVSRFLTLRKSLIFNFVYQDKAYAEADFYDYLARNLGNSKPSIIRQFYIWMDKTNGEIEDELNRIINDPKELKRIKLKSEDLNKIRDTIFDLRKLLEDNKANNKSILELFEPIEMSSPFSPYLRSSTTDSRTRDFALITLGDNPWSNPDEKSYPKRSLIAVCGLNRVSTAGAVKALLDKEEMKKHPLGGLISVETTPDNRGLRELLESEPEWITDEYKPQEISEAVENEFQSKKETQKYFELFDEKEFERYRTMINKYARNE